MRFLLADDAGAGKTIMACLLIRELKMRQAMDNSRAPFYLRRTKEAMVYFPQRRDDGAWATRPVFTKRITTRGLDNHGILAHRH